MRLRELINGIIETDTLVADVDVLNVYDDSRRVTEGCLFVAYMGYSVNGETFISQALEFGARVVIIGKSCDVDWEALAPHAVFIRVDHPRQVFAKVLARFYDHPSEQVRVLGVTGTNGKTTTTYILESIFKAVRKSCGVIGTISCRSEGKTISSTNTTPALLDNQIFLNQLRHDGVGHVVMEVSSHALDQGRLDGINFRGAVFTNLTGDHLDYHKTMMAYFEAKSRLFVGLSSKSYAVINIDDSYGRRLKDITPAKVMSYGMKGMCDVRGEIKEVSLAGMRMGIRYYGEKLTLSTSLIGLHNAYNILAAFTVGLAEGLAPEDIVQGIESLKYVPGRLERVDEGQSFYVFIDYAHTDDGLKNVLSSLQDMKKQRLIVLFGCGGDRDKSKRARMGRVVSELADVAILTSDNPRSEDPDQIIQDIVPGFLNKTYEIIVDRREAIEHALIMAKPGDIVLLAGKGHETYQVLKDGTVDFVERDIIRSVLKDKGLLP